MKNILIIEDSIDSAEMLSMLLEFRGHYVKCAYSGHEGILVASQFNPDVIMIDLGLPDMDGLDVVRQLAPEVWATHCVFVTVTGQDSPEIRRQAAEVGVDHFFVKGDEMSDLLSVVTGEHFSIANNE
jgi:DNA-binding response OmpR family regulator